MNILITGGAGFIGSNFIRRRIFDGDQSVKKIVNLDLLTYAGNPSNLKDIADNSRYIFVHGDIGNIELVSETLLKHKINCVINFAAESHVDRSIDSPEPFFQTNVIGTLRLLNCVKQYWKDLVVSDRSKFRFIHVSTDEVYGSLHAEEAPWVEGHAYAPNSPYAASKAASDHLVHSFYHTYGLPTITTNCSNNYGPYHFPEKLIPLIILNALEKRPLPIYGDGQQIRDWLYVEDHVEAIWIVMNKGQVGETYNIGGLNERRNIDIVNRICSILDRKAPREDGKSYSDLITFVADRPGHDRRYAIDSKKLRDNLGWLPTESFDTGIEKTVEWYLNNRAWCNDITKKKYSRERLGVI
jgi:dTDP-glucose 4,6-dehydratase